MNEQELVNAIAKRFFLTKTETKEIVEFFLEQITNDLKQGTRFYLRGFGSFTKQKHSAKKVRHPKTKKIITIPERITIDFNPSRTLIQKIKT